MTKEPDDVFFYAGACEARYFDAVDALTQPFQRTIRSVMASLIELQVNRLGREQLYILDTGSGTGSDAFVAWEIAPLAHVVAVDRSPYMNAVFNSKLDGEQANLLTLLEADFLSEDLNEESFSAFLPATALGFDIVFANNWLHHYPSSEKEAALSKMFSLLSPDGALIYSDLFSYASADFANWVHSLGEDWISRRFQSSEQECELLLQQIGDESAQLTEWKRWVRHWNEHHILDTIAGEKGAIRTLKAIGFDVVEVPLRLFEMAIVWAQK